MVDKIHQIRQWVGCGGIYDHLPVFLELKIGPTQSPSPLNFNKTWLKDESFLLLITSSWIHFNPIILVSAAFQFAANFKRLKGEIKEWSVGKKLREDNELKLLKDDILRILEGDGGGMLNQETKENLIRIEGRRNTLLLEREETWRLKSRAIWLECRDDNTIFFHIPYGA